MGLHWYQEGFIWFVLLLALIKTWARNNPVILHCPGMSFYNWQQTNTYLFTYKLSLFDYQSLKLQQTQVMAMMVVQKDWDRKSVV